MKIRNLYKKIQTRSSEFNQNNKAIANFILEKWNNMEEVTLKVITNATNQSNATIVRFCKEFGYKGFYEFRKSVLEINDSLHFNNKELIFNKNIFKDISVFEKEYWECMLKIRKSLLKALKNNHIQGVSKFIDNAEKIIIAGMNINYNQAIDFKNKLISLGKNCIIEQDLHLLNSLVHITNERNLVITISLSNENNNIIQFGELAQKNRAKWVHVHSEENQNFNYKPDIIIKIDVDESDIWNLYSIRGSGIFYLLNLIFANYIIFQKKEKNNCSS